LAPVKKGILGNACTPLLGLLAKGEKFFTEGGVGRLRRMEGIENTGVVELVGREPKNHCLYIFLWPSTLYSIVALQSSQRPK
jgi:hypothetical protein